LANLRETTGPLCGIDVSMCLTLLRGGLEALRWNQKRTAGPGSGVVEPSQAERQIHDVATSEDVGLRAHNLAIAITTRILIVRFTGRHC
jgi:hypothetical protein